MKRFKSEKGVYLLLSVAFIAVLVSLAIYVVGLGYLSGNRAILQNQANILALGAIERLVSSSQPAAQKKTDALNRVNQILKQNTMKGQSAPYQGSIALEATPDSDREGELEFGYWFQSAPGLGNCSSTNENEFPCFTTAAPLPGQNPNAARVRVRNTSLNPIIAPIVRSLGTLEKESFSYILPRCTADLIDLSYSAVQESHRTCTTCYDSAGPATPKKLVPITPSPPQAGTFAMPVASISTAPGVCDDLAALSPNYFYVPGDRERFLNTLHWCNLQPLRPTGSTDYSSHYQSDYLPPENSPLGQLYLDKVVQPQPLFRFLSAMNASFRLIKSSLTPGDGSMLMGFASDTVALIPKTGLTNDIDYLIQITNPENIYPTVETSGVPAVTTITPPVHPNYIDEGFIPRLSNHDDVASTNLVRALFNAAATLNDSNNCDPLAKKSIILATDGLGNCTPKTSNLASDYDCNDLEPTFLAQAGILNSTIRDILISRKIGLTVLIDAEAIDPHYLDIYDENVSPGNGSNFLTIDEARSLGYGVPGGKGAIFDETSDSYAEIGQAGKYYRKPLTVLGELAFKTGGTMCPLLKQCNNPSADCSSCPLEEGQSILSCYAADKKDHPHGFLRDCARTQTPTNSARQYCSFYNISKEQQAAECVARSVGGNPYAIGEPRTIK